MTSNSHGIPLAELGLGPEFPVGMHVLLIEPGDSRRKFLEKSLKGCRYKVSGEASANRALERVSNQHEIYDIVVTEIANLDVEDTILFLRIMREKMPVVVLSEVNDVKIQMRAFCEGRVNDYMVKPALANNLMTIWHHVLRRRMFHTFRNRNPSRTTSEQGPSNEKDKAHDDPVNHKLDPPMPNDVDEDGQNADGEPNCNDNGNSDNKKGRISWNEEDLHDRFVEVVNMLGGPDKAKPKKIHQLMNHPGLTRKSVASHLQKYRLALKNELNLPPIWMDENEVTPPVSGVTPGTVTGAAGSAIGTGVVANPYLANDQLPPNGNIASSSTQTTGLLLVRDPRYCYQMPIRPQRLGHLAHGNPHYRENPSAQPSTVVSPAMHGLNSGVPSRPPLPPDKLGQVVFAHIYSPWCATTACMVEPSWMISIVLASLLLWCLRS